MREQQRVRTRARILEVAAEEFDMRGYAAVSLSDIAAKLGMTKGTVYFHFATKAELARTVVEAYFGEWEDLQAEVSAQGLSGLAALHWLLLRVAERYRDDPGARAPLRLMREANVIEAALPTPFVAWIGAATRYLGEGQLAGDVRSDLDPSVIAWQLVAGFFGAKEVSHQLSRSEDLVERVSGMWSVFLSGVSARQ